MMMAQLYNTSVREVRVDVLALVQTTVYMERDSEGLVPVYVTVAVAIAVSMTVCRLGLSLSSGELKSFITEFDQVVVGV